MPSRFSRALLGLAAVALAILPALPAVAAETSNSEFVIIRADDTLVDDLYAGAIKVTVEGTIDGDLIAFAAEEVIINGTVTGSVFATAPVVTVNGRVGESLRVTSRSVWINGEVGNDVVAASAAVHLGVGSSVGNDVVAWTLEMDALGHVGGDLTGSQRRLALAGSVGGDVDVSVGQLTVVDSLTVEGDFGYRSDRDAEGLEKAEVGGATVHKTPLPPNIRVRALGFFGRFMVVIFLTISALTVAWGWPKRTTAAADLVSQKPAKTWLVGAAVMLSPVLLVAVGTVVMVVAPSSASLPLLALFGPLIIAAIGVVFALSLVAGIPAVSRLSRSMFKRFDTFGALLAASFTVGLLWLIPVVGWLVPVVVLPLGMGAWIGSWRTAGDEGTLVAAD